jgi:hypothetical protein
MIKFDHLVEGVYADEYTSDDIKQKILNSYRDRHLLKETPASHPEKFNPIIPPMGWKYDPYYECWIEI